MLSFLRKQESIFFRNCYYLFWIPAPAGMTEWVVYVLGALRFALCAMLLSGQISHFGTFLQTIFPR
jgi:hypothetical protein